MDIEELRKRVEAKRKAQEVLELKRELRGQNNEIDPNVIYVTTDSISKQTGVHISDIRRYVKNGEFPLAIKVGKRWFIHPDDAARFVGLHQMRKRSDIR